MGKAKKAPGGGSRPQPREGRLSPVLCLTVAVVVIAIGVSVSNTFSSGTTLHSRFKGMTVQNLVDRYARKMSKEPGTNMWVDTWRVCVWTCV